MTISKRTKTHTNQREKKQEDPYKIQVTLKGSVLPAPHIMYSFNDRGWAWYTNYIHLSSHSTYLHRTYTDIFDERQYVHITLLRVTNGSNSFVYCHLHVKSNITGVDIYITYKAPTILIKGTLSKHFYEKYNC